MKPLLYSLLIAAMAQLLSPGLYAQQPELQYFRPWDKRGINMFEPSKTAEQPEFTGFKIRIGGAFTQDFQYFKHSNTPSYAPLSQTDKTNRNFLYGVVAAEDSTSATLAGFNLAMANLNIDIQIADGIRVCLENYMSSRHHSEFWVKGGYIQMDKLPMLGNPEWFAKYLRVKIGHFQPNFGDMQFRRTDGGNTMFNPFVENTILDAFTTEIGGEAYVFPVKGLMGMVGMSSGLINGNIENYPETPIGSNLEPTKRNPSVYAKVAYDNAVTEDLRIRVSASMYNNASIQRNTLYGGDRTGSHYFMVMEPAKTAAAAASYSANFTSGRLNPGLNNRINTVVVNTFIKFKGLEVFGAYEAAKGRNYNEEIGAERTFNQLCAEGVYRFLPDEQLYVGARYVTVTGTLQGYSSEVSVARLAAVAGWFPTPNMLLKVEYASQTFEGFTDHRNGGKFNGVVVEAVIGF
ncbi:MAG: hypothetical protein NW241_07245 [Bacteroidia bacterium]|nr:hypothetical protein [Bacteroidia bacterium]